LRAAGSCRPIFRSVLPDGEIVTALGAVDDCRDDPAHDEDVGNDIAEMDEVIIYAANDRSDTASEAELVAD
jgi:hypothetical protein